MLKIEEADNHETCDCVTKIGCGDSRIMATKVTSRRAKRNFRVLDVSHSVLTLSVKWAAM